MMYVLIGRLDLANVIELRLGYKFYSCCIACLSYNCRATIVIHVHVDIYYVLVVAYRETQRELSLVCLSLVKKLCYRSSQGSRKSIL